MKYAEVAVNAPGGHLHSFSYSIPSSLNIEIGHAVWVPFGSKILQGVVVKLSDTPSVPETREIAGLIIPQPIISPERILLALWIADYYLSSLFDAIALLLPPGFEQRVITTIELSDVAADLTCADASIKQFIQYVKEKNRGIPLKELEDKFGKRKTSAIVRELVSRNILKKNSLLESEKVKPKFVNYLKLECHEETVQKMIADMRRKNAIKQADVLELLLSNHGFLAESNIRGQVCCDRNVIKALIKKGIVDEVKVEVQRNPMQSREFALELPISFTLDQQNTWDIIKQAINAEKDSSQSNVFILYGVTGSGKTEIYLRALDETIRRGKKGLCLVPEISLTPQIMSRFFARFPGRVAILHSRLTLGEQYDEWHRIHKGLADIVIGPRSAIFAPQPDLGLIIVDEEHEWAYKQSEKVPRYHAREAAIKLAELTGAVVILGSATPDVGTFRKGLIGEYKLVELKERVTPLGISPLPEVTIVNLREELKSGNRNIFSRLLKGQIGQALERKEQVILYINRRGQATFVECMNCGFVASCRRCSVALTYHAANNRLICHHCRRAYQPITICPKCGNDDMKYLGVGTEKVEAECKKLFPLARIIRFDSDTATRTKEYERIVNAFRANEADILIGTQIIAKGHDFPNVSLTGVINADTGLNLPDFRSGERTFQLLCQVSGRAGRGSVTGKAVIQTYNPGHYAIKYAANQDYTGFFHHEIKYRQYFGYPPFNDMVRLVYSHSDADRCRQEAENMLHKINSALDITGIREFKIIGPVPGYISRLRLKYRMQIILLGSNLQDFLRNMDFPRGWILDVDPVGMI